MKILAIETSCDETAISIINIHKKANSSTPKFTILGNQLFSQAKIHAQYGGVFPMVAKREHCKIIVPLLKLALVEAKMFKEQKKPITLGEDEKIYKKIFTKEPELFERFSVLIKNTKNPKIDTIAVTKGPGLEPALWVGINFAKALAHAWNIPILPINHMEGHIVVASLLKLKCKNMSYAKAWNQNVHPVKCEAIFAKQKLFNRVNPVKSCKAGAEQFNRVKIVKVKFPAVALLISGGHTELVLIKKEFAYKILGKTRDDAVGEAYDKVARMLGLPYPGGPQISKLADTVPNKSSRFPLPCPMLNSNNFDFSFSGLKTAVLYTIKKIPRLTQKIKAEIANEFENAVVEVLLKKTLHAAQKHKVQTIILGGGVSANKRLRECFQNMTKENNIELLLPESALSTDNALMIATAAYRRATRPNKKTKLTTPKQKASLTACGTLTL
ncbi:MAG: tRNA (adenosine(37)-N6)-threonylcarbamoyltransferase complex transferase subunit TsaD [Patescibacteria group bacterium]|nr:tRNA (adenosine(37)-N6)-threonylcarbamoyltransferase complex transferase subunit TsaD [Patescibacteria group bacterium]MBU1730096.1 tRNA (adenosine(37)-N6)-threonylcarbamoyltransferase complex transferase subunit TsaD [Patescibacteria group bacterium]MBU1956601.1 tRNA (adenosine(37)-N6)-threonylcarbamoyltransferase complex transferase subunit TsaD [Patescibacteria group bacterium]